MNILLTRPLKQVRPLETLVNKLGHQALLCPTLKIEALKNTPLKTRYDAVIFISANAVDYGLTAFNALGHRQDKLFAIGAVTAKKLQDYGYKVDAFPSEKASSESLLALNEVKKLKNKTILIFRGKGGRETLKEGLSKNNTVEYLGVYARVPCKMTDFHQVALSQFLRSNRGIIVVTSVENLAALMAMVGPIKPMAGECVKQYPLVVLSNRIKTYAQSIGFNRIEVAPQTSDKGLIQAIQCIL